MPITKKQSAAIRELAEEFGPRGLPSGCYATPAGRPCKSTACECYGVMKAERPREFSLLLYNLFMNKRAKKRIKEALEKGNLEREKAREEKNHPASGNPQKQRGFLPKPAKKRG